MSKIKKEIVIVGGGTCGWTTALYLRNFFWDKNEYNITILYSQEIGSIGVGESTIPHIVQFYEKLGITQKEIFLECNASIKLGVKFSNWNQKKDFIHPFIGGFTSKVFNNLQFCYWYINFLKHFSYDSIADMSSILFKQSKVPIDKEGKILTDFAFHLDANLLGQLLEKKTRERGVHVMQATITDFQKNENNITYINTKDENIKVDLLFDCTGFRGHFINSYKENIFHSFSQELPCNMAVIGRSYREENEDIPVYTLSTAVDSGWIWSIPLRENINGNGYVFSTDFLTLEDAKIEFMEHSKVKKEDIKEIHFRTGHYKESWVGNCIAIGSSYGFVEPLEATGIYLFCKQLEMFSESFSQNTPHLYNLELKKLIHEIKDFIVLHYACSKRTDTEFWKSFHSKNYSHSFSKKWRYLQKNIPGFNFESNLPLFKKESYSRILLGMDFYKVKKGAISYPNEVKTILGQIYSALKSWREEILFFPKHKDYLTNLMRKD